jgi:hypothetical protein
VRTLVVALALAFSVASCALLPAESIRPISDRCIPNAPRACTTVDGVALGEFSTSWDVRPPQACPVECHGPQTTARAEIELRFPDHPDIVAIDEFGPDWSALCGGELCTVSGYLGAFLFTFSDTTVLPIVVRCPGIGACEARLR